MMEPSFEKLLGVLAEAGVQFVLVGGLAVTLQGYVRFTEDVDLLIGSSRENKLSTELPMNLQGFPPMPSKV